jgi:FemAB-related protein (PEP-CTERM system-associated)
VNAPLAIHHSLRVSDLSDPREVERIEAFVREHGGNLFQRPRWLMAVERGTGQRALGLVTETMGAVTGWLPLTAVRSFLFGKALISSGFGVGGGILADGENSEKLLADAAENFAVDNGFASIELRGGNSPAGWNEVCDKHSGFERELAADDEAELLAIPRKARAEVRKSLKNDLTVRVGRGSADLAAHYAVYSESVRNLGTPVFPRSLFCAMLDAFPKSSDILTIEKGGAPIASVLSFYHSGGVMPFWGGGTFAARHERANELMYYELMLHARKHGMARFDFGRSKTGSGPYHFKKNWGFEPQPLRYSIWTAPGAKPRDIDPTGAGYARKVELWKKLPLPIANAIGPIIARGLA